MLVIISDLHLSDGSATSTLHPGAMHLFIQQMRDLAERAGWRQNGRYEPIERLDLVLLGDTLDIVSSNRWLDTGVRPYGTSTTNEIAQVTADIVDEILRQNQPALQLIRALVSDEIVTVSPGNQQGQPMSMSEGVPVAVRTHYVVGNRDWMLRLKGSAFDLIRQRISHHLGLATPYNKPFPHDIAESDDLLEVLRSHRCFARHGDIYDPLSFSGDRDVASISDAIVIELFSGFIRKLTEKMGDSISTSVMQQMIEIQHIRPMVLAPVYIEGLLQRCCNSPAQRKEVRRIWDTCVEKLLALTLLREQETINSLQVVDGLEKCLSFRRRLTNGWGEQSRMWIQKMRGAASSSFVQHAVTEPDFRNRRARHIIYGHTHQAEALPLDASYADGFVLNQMYFNTGTWRRVYQPTQIPGCEQEFIGMEAIGTVVVYHGDERSGRAYETLSGTLGMVYNNVIGGMEKISIADKVIAGPRRIPGEAPVSAVRTSTSTAGKTMY